MEKRDLKMLVLKTAVLQSVPPAVIRHGRSHKMLLSWGPWRGAHAADASVWLRNVDLRVRTSRPEGE